MRKGFLVGLIGLTVTVLWPADQSRQKQEVEPPTQTLEIPKEPPQAVTAETSRLVFYVSPLSSKGLLSQQVRDALRALLAQAGSSAIVRLRAFVAGSGDTRRVQAIVSETFTSRRQPLPVITVAQVGALPMAGVQVVLEATAVTRRAVNPHGLAFLSAQSSEQEGLPARLAPLARQTLPKLRGALAAAGLEGRDVVRVTCFLSSLEDVWDVRTLVAAEFPKAVYSFVQPERAPSHAVAACEAVARLRSPAGSPLRVLSAKVPGGSGEYSDVAVVGAPKVVLAGSQLAFGYQPEDARLAFQRLARTLEQEGSSLGSVAALGYYVLSKGIGEQAGKVAADLLNRQRPPAATVVPCVGLPALDAGFAIDAVAVPSNSQ